MKVAPSRTASAKLVEAFVAAVTRLDAPWLIVQHHHGKPAVEAAYAQVLRRLDDPAAVPEWPWQRGRRRPPRRRQLRTVRESTLKCSWVGATPPG